MQVLLTFRYVNTEWSRENAKCSKKITVYQPVQNLYQLIKHSRNGIHVMSDITM